METYCYELAAEIGKRTNLHVKVLPGRANGQPPSAGALIVFCFRMLVFLAVSGRQYGTIHVSDLVLCPLLWWTLLVAPKATLIASAHGTDIAFGRRDGVAPAIYHRYLWLAGRVSSVMTVIANSRATAELCHRYGFLTVHVVPLGVRAARPTGPMQAESYVLFVGRLVRRKGIAWFIHDVLPLLPETIILKVAGTTWDREESEALQHPRVEFLGPVHGIDLANLRRRAISVIMPNISRDGRDFEGFGLTALEAAADGGILLAARLQGIEDAVYDGVTGFLLLPEKPHIWAAKIMDLSNWSLEDRRKFIADAQVVIRSYFTWERVAEETLRHYAD
jgi:glycosyltransferase involved in cell wall biosynthesis